VHSIEEKVNDDSSLTREESPADVVHVHSVSESVPDCFKIPVEVNGIPITMELDTGAAVSLVSEATWFEQLHRPKTRALYTEIAKLPRPKSGNTR